MAQVETQSAFQHPSQHSNYYYSSTSSSHSSGSSSANSHHSSPRSPSIIPPRYCSPYYDDRPGFRSAVNPAPQSTYNSQPGVIESGDDDTSNSPFPAYDHATPCSSPPPELNEEDEDEYDVEEDEDDFFDSPDSGNASSPSATFPRISDDIWTERGLGPSRQVDYLSHNWAEPDIWSSWRYIRKEKAGYPQNAARLENASWRTWAKSKYKLKTITPETLNWLKDCDVTWLYGPLQSQAGPLARSHADPPSPAYSEPDINLPRQMSRSSSFSAPSKPILKKRSHSEVMLTTLAGKQQGNLLTRAAQAVQDERRREAEEKELREEQRKNPLTPTHVLRSQQRIRRKGSTDLASFVSPDSPFNVKQDVVVASRTDYFGANWASSGSSGNGASNGQSGGQTPSASKHIHFNDRVEQCIAVDSNVPDEEEDTTTVDDHDDDESEDEGLFMMKSKPIPAKQEPHTIAKLPATTLRPGDEPIHEPPQVKFNLQSPSRGSQEDLNTPDHPGFFYEEGGGFSTSMSPPQFPPRAIPIQHQEEIDDFSFDHPFASQSISENIPSLNTSTQTSTTSSRRSSILDLEEESQRRASVAAIPIPTARTMNRSLMGEDEEDEEGMGIVGLAADAISTAKDLVGVLWNAGWGGRR